MASQDSAFLYPERRHAYDVSKNYKEVTAPEEVVKLTNDVVDRLQRELLPRLGMFSGFDVHFVEGLEGKGTYAVGTVSRPVILLDWSILDDVIGLTSDPRDIEEEIALTILFCLACALQEARDGEDFCPEEAEAFSITYLYQNRPLSSLARYRPE